MFAPKYTPPRYRPRSPTVLADRDPSRRGGHIDRRQVDPLFSASASPSESTKARIALAGIFIGSMVVWVVVDEASAAARAGLLLSVAAWLVLTVGFLRVLRVLCVLVGALSVVVGSRAEGNFLRLFCVVCVPLLSMLMVAGPKSIASLLSEDRG